VILFYLIIYLQETKILKNYFPYPNDFQKFASFPGKYQALFENILQKYPTKISDKNIRQKYPTKIFDKNIQQKYLTKRFYRREFIALYLK